MYIVFTLKRRRFLEILLKDKSETNIQSIIFCLILQEQSKCFIIVMTWKQIRTLFSFSNSTYSIKKKCNIDQDCWEGKQKLSNDSFVFLVLEIGWFTVLFQKHLRILKIFTKKSLTNSLLNAHECEYSQQIS